MRPSTVDKLSPVPLRPLRAGPPFSMHSLIAELRVNDTVFA
jgi:hypothetical protein